MHHRSDDPPIKIVREIPLPWLIGIVGAGFIQAALVYFKQDAQAEAIIKLTTEVKQLTIEVGTKNVKDVEHDLRIADHERRLLILEGRMK